MIPKTIWISSSPYGESPEDERVALVWESRGAVVRKCSRKQIERGKVSIGSNDLAVGTIDFTSAALRNLGSDFPENNDYPEALHPLLRRKVWRGIVRDIQYPVFMKPLKHKRWTGLPLYDEEDFDRLSGGRIGRNTQVWFSEIVKIEKEHRVFLVNGKIVGVQDAPMQDMPIPRHQETLDFLEASLSRRTLVVDLGYSLGLPILIETNPPISVGSYGLPAETYADFLWAGWQEIINQKPVGITT